MIYQVWKSGPEAVSSQSTHRASATVSDIVQGAGLSHSKPHYAPSYPHDTQSVIICGKADAITILYN